MGLFQKLLRKAVKSVDRKFIKIALPRVKPDDLLPDNENIADDDEAILAEAQSGGDAKVLHEYLVTADGTDEDFAPDANDSVLTLAARTGDLDLFNMLFQIPGIDINAQNPSNETVLLVAEKEGHTEVVLMLLEHSNVDVNLKDKNNETVLTYAAEKNDIVVIKALLEQHPVDINARTKSNDTALTIAARRGHVEAVEALLTHPEIDINARNEMKSSALVQAACNGYTEVATRLLQRPGIEVNAATISGDTALICAARQGHTAVVTALLAHPDIDVNVYTEYHDTALMWAARNNHTDIFLRLLAHDNVNTTLVNKDDKTAPDLVMTDELKLILKIYNKRTPTESPKLLEAPVAPARVVLDKSRRSHAASHPSTNVLLVQSSPTSGYEKWRDQLSTPWQALTPSSNHYVSHIVTATMLLFFVFLYILSRIFLIKTNVRAGSYTPTGPVSHNVDNAPLLEGSSEQRLAQKSVRKTSELVDARQPCCPFCPEVSLIAIHYRHIQCLQVGLVHCGPHDKACTRASEINRVDFLEILHQYNSPWNHKTSSAAAALGHLEALRFVMINGCDHEEDIVYHAACIGSLPCLEFLLVGQGVYWGEDGRAVGAAFERGHLDCLNFLVDHGCPFSDVYTFGGPEMWLTYESYLTNASFDARFKQCIEFAVERDWALNQNLVLYVNAHAAHLPECVVYLQSL